MKLVLNDVFIVPDDAAGLIAADMELTYMDNDTVQMRIKPDSLAVSGLVVNFSKIEMIEYLTMVQRLEEAERLLEGFK